MAKPLFLIALLALCAPAFADEVPAVPAAAPLTGPVFVGPGVPARPLCEGDGCDAWLGDPLYSDAYRDRLAARRMGSVLGGVSGALIGEEIGGLPGALGLGALGAVLGYAETGSQHWRDDAIRFDAAWQRGDDIYYNPVHPIPYNPHYFGGNKHN